MNFRCCLTFSIKNIQIDQCEERDVTAELHFGDETIFTLKENENSKFNREITVTFESSDAELQENLVKNAPKKLIVFRDSFQIGECRIDWIDTNLDEISKNEFESSETELEYEIVKNMEFGEFVVNGIVQLFISFTKSRTTMVARATSFAFDAFGGTIDPEELLLPDINNTTSQVDSYDSDEKEYFIVDGNLINLNKIRGPCTNTKCPVALLAQYDLENIRKEKCDCQTKCHNSTRYFNNIRAINPYISKSEGSLNILEENRIVYDNFSPPAEGSKTMFERCNVIEPSKYEDKLCSNCMRNLSCVTEETNCPLCDVKKVSPKPTTLKTPILVSMSEEFYTNRLPATQASGVRPRGCPCCVKNKKKCDNCINYCKKLKGRRYNSSSELDVISQDSSLQSRLSMYGSINNIRKSYTSGSRYSRGDREKKRLSNKYYHDDTTTRTSTVDGGKSRSDRDKSNSRVKGQVSSYESDVIPGKRAKGKFKSGKRGQDSCNESDDMTCAERLAMVRRKLKNKRMARKRVSKTMHAKTRYSYRFGKRPPGMKIGHRACTADRGLVPRNMGWLWNVPTLGINKLRIGWKPGAVTKPIKELMMHFLANYPCDTLSVTKPPKKSIYTDLETPCLDPCNRSTLQVKKQNGEFLISMNPLKDSENLRPGENPYLSCPPIKFKIEKDPEQQKLDYCRDTLKKMGFCECTCPDGSSCTCRTPGEKQLLKREMKRLSNEMKLKVSMTNEDFTLSQNEEEENNVDIEFTPPSAAVGKKPKTSKIDTKATETQYNDKDFLLPTPTDKKLINTAKGVTKGIGTDKGGKNIPKDGKLGSKTGGVPGKGKGGASGTNKGNASGKSGLGKAGPSGSNDISGSSKKGNVGRKNGIKDENEKNKGQKNGQINKKGYGNNAEGGDENYKIKGQKNGQNNKKRGDINASGGGAAGGGGGAVGGGGSMITSSKDNAKTQNCVITDPCCIDSCINNRYRSSCIKTPFYNPCCTNVCNSYC